MNAKNLIQLAGAIILAISITVLILAWLGEAQDAKGINASPSSSTPQQEASQLPARPASAVCEVYEGGSIKAALKDTACTTITVHAGDYREDDWYKFERSGVTLQADGEVIINAIIVYGDNNVVRGFTITDPEQKAGIRTYGNYNVVEYNEIHDTYEDSIWLWGKGNIIRGNYMHDVWVADGNNEPFDNHVDCFMTWAWSPAPGVTVAEDIIIEDNICILDRDHGSNQFFLLTRDPDDGPVIPRRFIFRNNIWIAKDSGYVPLAFFGDSTTEGIKIYNNTFYNTTNKGESIVWGEGGMPDCEIYDNKSYGYGSIIRPSAGDCTNVNNQLLPYSGLPQIIWPPDTGTFEDKP